jgi:ketosteroid isomerase-like protein
MQSAVEVRTQILEALERFNELVSTKNPQVLEEFATGDDVLLIGSDLGEIAAGRQELAVFFDRIFTRDASYSWQFDRINVSYKDDLAWFFADGWVILTTGKEQRKSPYRVSGVFECKGERWLWRQYHGSEPVIAE